jgi:thymidylate kinase
MGKKLIICEGPDRVGKDTLISFIKSKINDYEVIHFSTPEGKTNEEKIAFQKSSFRVAFENVKSRTHDIIHNRSHIGENVYGRKYRQYNPEWIFDLEREFDYHKDSEIYLILLIADPAFLLKNEDGLSLSNKLEDKQEELELFIKSFTKSVIPNKICISVDSNGEYRNIVEIQNVVSHFLNL